MSNARDLRNLARILDSGTSGQVLTSGGGGSVSFQDAGGTGVTVHADQAAMISADAASAVSEGSLHYETSSNKLYVKMGNAASSGFYLLASITNATPTISSPSTGTSFTLTGGSPTTVSVVASDADIGQTLNYYYTVSTGSIGSGTTVTTSLTSGGTYSGTGNAVAGSSNASTNSHFRINPSSSVATSFSLTFYVTDGTNTANTICSFELSFFVTNSKYTSLLMTTDGSTGGNQSITYDTASSTGNSLTVNGDAHAGSFSPYRHGGYSLFFDGTDDRISIAGSTDFDFGTSPFTISFWYYKLDDQRNDTIFDTSRDASGSWNPNGRIELFGSYGTVAMNVTATDGTDLTPSGPSYYTPSTNVWNYLRITRSSNGDLTLYENGVQKLQKTGIASSSLGNSNPVSIGARQNGSNWYKGYVTDLEIVKGTDLGNSVPTERVTAHSSGKLLIGALPYIGDKNSSPKTITISSEPSTKPFAPYNNAEYSAAQHGGAIFFDGSGDYLTLGSGTATIPSGGSDFTLEFWAYITTTSDYHTFIDFDAANAGGFKFYYNAGSDKLTWYTYASSINMEATNVFQPFVWNHVALTRDNYQYRLFVNGVLEGNSTTGISLNQSAFDNARIGLAVNGFNPMEGYISDVKWNPTTANYTSAFTPPTAPLSSSNAGFYIKGTDAHVLDKSQGNNIKLMGSAASATPTSTINNSGYANTKSLNCGGLTVADYATFTGVNANVYAAPFTIEGFFYTTSNSTAQGYFSFYTDDNNLSRLRLGSNGNLYFYITSSGSSNVSMNSSGGISANTWQHIAVQRDSSSNFKMYIAGSQAATSTLSGTPLDVSNMRLNIGFDEVSVSPKYFGGFIQDLRISTFQRYTPDGSNNITVPTSPLKG